MHYKAIAFAMLLGLVATACGTSSKTAAGTAGQPDRNAVVNVAWTINAEAMLGRMWPMAMRIGGTPMALAAIT